MPHAQLTLSNDGVSLCRDGDKLTSYYYTLWERNINRTGEKFYNFFAVVEHYIKPFL
jgi:hypothetical protein